MNHIRAAVITTDTAHLRHAVYPDIVHMRDYYIVIGHLDPASRIRSLVMDTYLQRVDCIHRERIGGSYMAPSIGSGWGL